MPAIVRFYELSELDEVSLAYAPSIHKSQGSKYPAVVIPLAMQHDLMLERHLLYIAVTRGRKLVVVIAEPKALAIAVRNRKATRRGTRLAWRLAETEWASRKEGDERTIGPSLTAALRL